MKKNKLYTANKWNQPAFMVSPNRFDLGGNAVSWDRAASRAYGANYGDAGFTLNDYMNSKNAFGISKADNPFSKGNLSGGIGAMAQTSIGGAVSGGLAGEAGNLISGGLSSGAGNAIGSIGSAVGSVNPALGLAVELGSSLINRAVGTSVDQAKLNAANEGTAAYNNFQSNAASFDDVKGPTAQASVKNAYSGGWFSSGSARRKNEELKRQRREAKQFAFRSVDNNISNIANEQINNAMANYSALGGPLLNENNDGMGAIDYDFLRDYLTEKKRQNDIKNKQGGLVQMPAFMNGYALGGDIQTNGADWSTGLMTIGAGGSHEENPNEGVQLGIDPEGAPNLVEEGETVFDDYVYSNRILADATTKQMFGLPKKRDITFAEISKKLEKESSERSNDPISQAGLQAQMHKLADEQERQKQEMEAEKAKAAFEAMTPEEQVAVMNSAAQQAQQQAMAEQEAMQQPSPEEIALAQQQQAMMSDGSEPSLGQEPEMMAYGGRVNRFDNGGKAYARMLNALEFHTKNDFEKWAKENGIDFGDLWKDNENTLNKDILGSLWDNEKFKEALRKKNPALAHAFEDKGYDFGLYEPGTKDKATIQSISKGNWKTTDGKGWRGSEDLAFKQATEGLSDEEIDALTTEQLAERMKNTDAYKNTNKWLQNSDNALLYLNTLLNDPDTPQVAKDYAAKYVKEGKWKDGFNYDYGTVFGSNGQGVREVNPGTYWHTVMEANRGNQAGNFVINEDGTIEPIVGNVPTDWVSTGNYQWSDENDDYVYNYYKRPVVASSSSTPPSEENTEEEDTNEPWRRAEWLRYAGLFGPYAGLRMQMAGIGKPNTGAISTAIQGAGDVTPASWKPLGNYLTNRELDVWYEQNKLNANARATERNIMNTSGGNRGTAMAGLLAAGYNSQLASGNLFRQAQEYNDNLRKQVAEFNRGTDQFNSEQFGQTSRFNADAYNQTRRANAQLKLQAAQQKADMDAGWYGGIYGNVAGLFKGLGDLGTENYRMNRIAEMGADGIFGSLGNSHTGKMYRKNKKSKGGKVNKKRGLTF